jgi:hypothetical protein
LIAVLNAALGQNLGFVNPLLYELGSSFFRDIDPPPGPGDNSFDGTPGYSAGPGWDACTGWGSPNGTALLAGLQTLLTKDLVFITDRNTFGKDEIDAMLHLGSPATITAAFYIEVDGFRGESWFNAPAKGATTADSSSFLKAILSNLNSGTTGGQTFDNLPATEDGSSLALYQYDNSSKAVFNFALSRVRYRSLNPPDPTDVRVFFRLCPALSVSVDYDLTTTYRRSPGLNPDGQPIPVLGLASGNLVTIPLRSAFVLAREEKWGWRRRAVGPPIA